MFSLLISSPYEILPFPEYFTCSVLSSCVHKCTQSFAFDTDVLVRLHIAYWNIPMFCALQHAMQLNSIIKGGCTLHITTQRIAWARKNKKNASAETGSSIILYIAIRNEINYYLNMSSSDDI